VRRIVYQQGILKRRTRKFNKGIEKVFTKNWFIRIVMQEVIISKVKQLVHYLIGWKANINFLDDNFQVLQKKSLRCRRPYVHRKCFYTSG
jgi:hypothetical protein